LLVVVTTPLLWEIDLEAVADTVQLDVAIEEAGLLRRFGFFVVRFGLDRTGCDRTGRE
jgi:hypothetical protein